MNARRQKANPFPGLRPFREDEEYLFFGRESQVDAMVDKLAANKFLSVVGTSGSGKSSLVNCGLRPALHGGLMAGAGTGWRMAQFRPGSEPIQSMALALAEAGVLFKNYQAKGLSLQEIIDTTLRMSKLGLVDMAKQADLGNANLLVIVDQFEELFRFRQHTSARQEASYGVSETATEFVNLLLEATRQTALPIYVVMTMRSDFLGDCAEFAGLADAINDGQYLVPRLTRDERRAAISGPVGVGGAQISPVLLTRLVNDVGNNPDQLSILQHALNRTWARWEFERDCDAPLNLTHYEAIGTMAHALDQHADKAFSECKTQRQRFICEKMFKAITDKATDQRGIRRPTRLSTLCALADASQEEITEVIDVFRKPSRSFLMPPAGEALTPDTVIDISHESLMRVWQRLNTWADEETRSAQTYRRLSETAALYDQGYASLWQDPDLQRGLDWQEREQPTEVWASLYDGDYPSAMGFLKKSREVRDAEREEAEFERHWRIVRNVLALLMLALFLWKPLGIVQQFQVIETVMPERVSGNLPPDRVIALPAGVIKVLVVDGVLEATDKHGALVTSRFTEKNLERAVTDLPVAHIVASLNRNSRAFRQDASEQRIENALTRAGYDQATEATRIATLVTEGVRRSKKSDVLNREIAWDSYFYAISNITPIAESPTNQPALIRTLSSSSIPESCLRYPGAFALLGEAASVGFYLIAYLILVSTIRKWYPRNGVSWNLDWRRGVPAVAGWQSWWHIVRILRYLWAALLACTGLGLCLVIVNDVSHPLLAFLFAVTFGPVPFLIVQPELFFNQPRATKIRIWQGRLMQASGIMACVYGPLLFLFSMLGADLSVEELFVFALAAAVPGCVLLYFGARRSRRGAEAMQVCSPDVRPVAYLMAEHPINSDGWDALVQWLRGLRKSKDEKTLHRVFSEIGPFVSIRAKGALNDDEREDLKRSEFVIVQVDDRISDEFAATITESISIVRPDRLLIYFSGELAGERLNAAYREFAAHTRGCLPGELPPSIGSNHLISFDQDTPPRTFGQLNPERGSWSTLLPLIGNRWDQLQQRGRLRSALRPIFEKHGWLDPNKQVISGSAIAMAAMVPFDAASASMIYENLKSFGPKRRAAVCFAIAFTLSLLLLLTGPVFPIVAPALMYWFWKTVGGPEAQRHAALGGRRPTRWRVIGLFVVVTALSWLPFAASFYAYQYRQSTLIAAKIEAIREKGEPTTASELDAFYDTLSSDRETAKRLVALGEPPNALWSDDLPFVDDSLEDEDVPAPDEEWPALDRAVQFLAAHADFMKQVHELAPQAVDARYETAFEQHYAMLLPETEVIILTRMLALEAHVRAHKDDTEGVAQSITDCFSIGNGLRSPMIGSQMTAAAINRRGLKLLGDLLPQVDFSDDQLREFQRSLRNADIRERFRQALLGERVVVTLFYDDLQSRWFVEQVRFLNDYLLDEIPPVVMPITLLTARPSFRRYLDRFHKLLEVSKQPLDKQRSAFADTETYGPSNPFDLFALFDLAGYVWEPFALWEAERSAVDAAIAVQRYRGANSVLPESLNDLVPEFLPAVPVDPFDGQPMRYKLGEDVLIYSVGTNEMDDDGDDQLKEPNEWGDYEDPLDIVVRLPR